MSKKSKSTQALYLFEHGKKPIEVAIELDTPPDQLEIGDLVCVEDLRPT